MDGISGLSRDARNESTGREFPDCEKSGRSVFGSDDAWSPNQAGAGHDQQLKKHFS